MFAVERMVRRWQKTKSRGFVRTAWAREEAETDVKKRGRGSPEEPPRRQISQRSRSLRSQHHADRAHCTKAGRDESLAETERENRLPVTIEAGLLQVGEQAAALRHHQQKATTRVVVVAVRLEVFRQVGDAVGKERNLNLGRTGVALVRAELGDDFGRLVGVLGHIDLFCKGFAAESTARGPRDECWRGANKRRLRTTSASAQKQGFSLQNVCFVEEQNLGGPV